jgi:hypothetical protein
MAFEIATLDIRYANSAVPTHPTTPSITLRYLTILSKSLYHLRF